MTIAKLIRSLGWRRDDHRRGRARAANHPEVFRRFRESLERLAPVVRDDRNHVARRPS